NDQVRFDIAFQVLCPEMRIIAPIREEKLSRDEEYRFLEERGVEIPASAREYSINSGLWGSTIGGGETHDPWKEIPVDVYEQAVDAPRKEGSEHITVGFDKGVPISLDGESLSGVDLIRRIGDACRAHRIGLGIHIGDTVLGIKGRIAFEAGAAVVLIHAHRELEKITTTAWQRFWKDHLAEFYGKLLHEGLPFEPALRDIEAMIDSSQQRVIGDARILLDAGRFSVVGVRSPYSLAGVKSGVYGEMPVLWEGRDVQGFSTIAAIPSRLHRLVRRAAEEETRI
ncbi:MAG: argininosuccinate synthase, partial [Planctomycetes bacterium]|nr:argininosuccinate synthase [Planctomycetota bacterium]